MNPSTRIREIADLAGNIEVKERLEQLAAEFEVQHNQQNNQFASVIGRVELKVQEEIDALRFDINQAFGDSEARQRQMLKMMEALQTELRSQRATGDAK